MTNEDSYFLFDRPGPFIVCTLTADELSAARAAVGFKPPKPDDTVVDAIAYLDQKEQHWDE